MEAFPGDSVREMLAVKVTAYFAIGQCHKELRALLWRPGPSAVVCRWSKAGDAFGRPP
jgi:hypothetical protein